MKLTFSSVTSGLLGGLVLSYVLFMAYVLTVAQQSQVPATRIATAGCFSFGSCQVTSGGIG
jgi:hypothetical protein